jgi:hypothetical protein
MVVVGVACCGVLCAAAASDARVVDRLSWWAGKSQFVREQAFVAQLSVA